MYYNSFKPIYSIAIVFVLMIVSVNEVFAKEKRILDSTARASASGNYIQLPQGNIHYEMVGADTAETVVLMCGLSAGYYIWDSTMLYLQNAGFRVIRFEHFGRGYSERICGAYDKAFYQSELTELLKALNITKPISIVASSMGGAISAEYAIDHPQMVKSLVLLDPMITPFEPNIVYRKRLGPLSMNLLFGPLIRTSQMRSFYNQKPFEGWDETYKTTSQFVGSKYALLETMKNYLHEDKLHVYKKIQEVGTPVFLVWGKQDITIKYSLNELIRSVLECKFLGVDEAGHLPQLEQSSKVNPEIIQFIRTHQ